MIKLDRIYTRGGDGGKTSLGDGTRVGKDDPRILALCAVDEANAALGIARLHLVGTPHDARLARIQNDLFDLGADLATPGKVGALRITAAQVEGLEAEIDALTGDLEPLTSFILPGGTPASAHAHMARTVTRRAELAVAALMTAGGETSPAALPYLNRLSDYLFVLARTLNDGGKADRMWAPGQG